MYYPCFCLFVYFIISRQFSQYDAILRRINNVIVSPLSFFQQIFILYAFRLYGRILFHLDEQKQRIIFFSGHLNLKEQDGPISCHVFFHCSVRRRCLPEIPNVPSEKCGGSEWITGLFRDIKLSIKHIFEISLGTPRCDEIQSIWSSN